MISIAFHPGVWIEQDTQIAHRFSRMKECVTALNCVHRCVHVESIAEYDKIRLFIIQLEMIVAHPSLYIAIAKPDFGGNITPHNIGGFITVYHCVSSA